jgi:hypothetical protein
MSINDLHCDRCGRLLTGLAAGSVAAQRLSSTSLPDSGTGVRFGYHPGNPALRDESGLLCGSCWREWTSGLATGTGRCARCGDTVTRDRSLFLRELGARSGWQLCPQDAARQLNGLRTVEPKLDPATFALPRRRRPRR